MEVARRLRNTNTLPENGSSLSFARHNSANESIPLRKSTASTATKIRIYGVMASMTYDAANARINSASWLVAIVLKSSRSLPPLADSTSTTQLVAVPVLAASSSTKAGAVLPSSRCRRGAFGDLVEARGSNRSVHF